MSRVPTIQIVPKGSAVLRPRRNDGSAEPIFAFGLRPVVLGRVASAICPPPWEVSPRTSAMGESRRAALTLVELLVVVTILVILTGVVIPVITPSLESRRMREAARQVNLYLNRARSMAMEKRRPVGVWLQRRQDLPQAVTQLFLVEEVYPIPIDVSSARIQISTGGSATFIGYTPQEGDCVQVNLQGPFCDLIRSGNSWVLQPRGVRQTPPPPTPQGGVPFQVRRIGAASFQRNLASPLELPAGLAVDTEWSGVGTGSLAKAFAPSNAQGDILIMFSPTGEIDSVGWFTQSGQQLEYERRKVTEPIFLLVGKLNRIPQGEDGLPNWRDLGNRWVAIMPQTGLVKTVELASGADYIQTRRFAAGQSMGGK